MNKLFVVDSSFILKHLLRDEQNNDVDEIIRQFIKKEIFLYAPEILGVEVANALRSAFLRRRITQSEVINTMDLFIQLEIEEKHISVAQVLNTSLKHNISCYDAAYIALAREKKAKLLTFDERLRGI